MSLRSLEVARQRVNWIKKLHVKKMVEKCRVSGGHVSSTLAVYANELGLNPAKACKKCSLVLVGCSDLFETYKDMKRNRWAFFPPKFELCPFPSNHVNSQCKVFLQFPAYWITLVHLSCEIAVD